MIKQQLICLKKTKSTTLKKKLFHNNLFQFLQYNKQIINQLINMHLTQSSTISATIKADKLFKVLNQNSYTFLKVVLLSQSSLYLAESIMRRRMQYYRQNKSIKSIFDPTNMNSEIKSLDNKGYLITTTEFINHNDLIDQIRKKQYLPSTNSNKISKSEVINSLVKKIISLLFRGQNEYFYSFDNIIYDKKNQKMDIAWTSLVGLEFARQKKTISREDFAQIYQLMDSQFFNKPNMSERMNFKLKFRSLGMIILNLILEKKLSVLFQKNKLNSVINLQEAKKILSTTKGRFQKLLNMPEIKNKIMAVDRELNVNYYNFLKAVFVEQSELTWQNIFETIVPKKNVKDNKQPTVVNLTQIISKIIKPNSERECYLRNNGCSTENTMLMFQLKMDIQPLLGYENVEKFLNWDQYANRYCNQELFKGLLALFSQIKDDNLDKQLKSKQNQQSSAIEHTSIQNSSQPIFGALENTLIKFKNRSFINCRDNILAQLNISAIAKINILNDFYKLL